MLGFISFNPTYRADFTGGKAWLMSSGCANRISDQAILPIRRLYDGRDRAPFRGTLHGGKSRSAEI